LKYRKAVVSLYVVIAVSFDRHGEVERVRWAKADGPAHTLTGRLHNVGVDRVLEAIDRGDVVELRFQTAGGSVSGGRLRRKLLPGGTESVTEVRGVKGRTLHDLPTF
jgi:hypothetical protein